MHFQKRLTSGWVGAWICLLSLTACGEVWFLPDQTPLPEDVTVVDRFDQNALPARDVLWVIDNTPSMRDELATLSSLFSTFIEALSSHDVAWQVGMVTTDADFDEGRLAGLPPILTPATPDVANVFASNILAVAQGNGTPGIERGLSAAVKAVTAPNIAPGGANYGFLRDDAGLYVIVVSDSDDKSADPVETYVNALRGVKANLGEEGLQLSAIVGLDDASSCFGTVPGTRYMAAAELLSGSVYSICSDDWDALLTSLGWSMISLESSFKLSQVPRETDSMVVTVGDVIVEQGSAWQFDATRNSIVFEAEAVPAYGSRIRVTYRI
ncbi:MAG: hypothetical protein ACKO6N_15920 [Myxococcota bacterium]